LRAGNGGVPSTVETQPVAGIQVGFLLALAFALQVAPAQIDAGVDADAFRAEGQANFATSAAAFFFSALGISGCGDQQVVAGRKVDVATSPPWEL